MVDWTEVVSACLGKAQWACLMAVLGLSWWMKCEVRVAHHCDLFNVAA